MTSPRNVTLPLLDFLFPNQTLDEAWESYPLLSTSYPTVKYHYQSTSCRESATTVTPSSSISDNTLIYPIPTINQANSSHTTKTKEETWKIIKKRIEFVQKIFHISKINNILSPFSNSNIPDLTYGHQNDFQLVKKIIDPDGINEWLGIFNPPSSEKNITVEEAFHVFQKGRFSLVIHNMQERWKPITSMAEHLAREILPAHVSCNLYLTPAVPMPDPSPTHKNSHAQMNDKRISAFETHFDWMDVIIIQVSGEKLWSIASSPLVYLPTKHMKYKPTMDELKHYNNGTCGKNEKYSEFLLRPGDVLYIPRGFLHNASTISHDTLLVTSTNNYFDNYNNNNHNNNNDDDDDDDDDDIHKRLNEPSLHLTFGIEHDAGTTIQHFLSFAFSYFSEIPTLNSHEDVKMGHVNKESRINYLNDIRICTPLNGACSNKEQKQETFHDSFSKNSANDGIIVSWNTLLQVALKEISQNHCTTLTSSTTHNHNNHPPESSCSSSFKKNKMQSNGNNSDKDGNHVGCILRKSVPFHPIWRNIFLNQTVRDRDKHDDDDQKNDSNIEMRHFFTNLIMILCKTKLNTNMSMLQNVIWNQLYEKSHGCNCKFDEGWNSTLILTIDRVLDHFVSFFTTNFWMIFDAFHQQILNIVSNTYPSFI